MLGAGAVNHISSKRLLIHTDATERSTKSQGGCLLRQYRGWARDTGRRRRTPSQRSATQQHAASTAELFIALHKITF